MEPESEIPVNIVLQAGPPRIEIVDADSDHAFRMAPRLRKADAEEVAAIVEGAPLLAVLDSMRSSDRSFVALVDGEPVMLCGVAPHPDDPDTGIPWMLTTDGIYAVRDEFIRFSQPIFERTVGTKYKRLANITSATNEVAHRWLLMLGFTLGPELPGAGINGEDLMVLSKEL